MNYYNEIKNELINNEITKKVKDYSKNRSDLTTYYNVGRLLSEAGKHYGEGIIKEYSRRLASDLGKKYNERTLRRMRQFYYIFSKENWSPVATNLSWSHYSELLSLNDFNKILYYIQICVTHNLSKRQLRERIKNKEYERLDDVAKEKLIANKETSIVDLIKNPIVIKNNNNREIISEKVLQKLILENLPSFLDELGEGFTFVKNEYKIKIGNSYNYIDLLLYNIKFNCFVVVELKVTELKKEHIGQIEIYMNYIDKTLRKVTQDKTIGIIICKKDNKFIMEYCSDSRILSKEYKLIQEIYMNYYKEIKNELINNEITKKVKDYSKNRSDLTTYYNVGRLLSEAGKHYGEGIIKEYSRRLASDLGKKYNERTLRRMRQFYYIFSKENWSPVATNLSWSHYSELLSLNDFNKILYYIQICVTHNLSKRQLRERIKNKEYERLDDVAKEKLIANKETSIVDLIKNPIVIKNNNNREIISEKVLQKLILENLPSFLDELGEGFTFVKNEYKIKIGNSYNYIDLLLYNIKFNCYVVVELKVTELKKEHIGQIEVYMNYIDKNLRKVTQDKTIGIIICKKDNKFIMEYCSDSRILSKEYKLV